MLMVNPQLGPGPPLLSPTALPVSVSVGVCVWELVPGWLGSHPREDRTSYSTQVPGPRGIGAICQLQKRCLAEARPLRNRSGLSSPSPPVAAS